MKTLWGAAILILGLIMASPRVMAQDTLEIRFTGPDRTHVIYHGTAPGDGGVKLVVTEPGGGERQIAYAEGAGAVIQGPLRDTDLVDGTYRYKILRSERDPQTELLGPWMMTESRETIVTELAAKGDPIFDEELANIRLDGVYVADGITVTLGGVLSAPIYDMSALTVAGTLLLDGPLILVPYHAVTEDGEITIPFRVNLNTATSLSLIAGGDFSLNVAGSSFSECTGIRVIPKFGGTLTSITNGVVELLELDEGKTLSISDSSCTSGFTPGSIWPYGSECRNGTLMLERVIWNNRFEATGAAEVAVSDCDFVDTVKVWNEKTSTDNVIFSATSCRFSTLSTSLVGTGVTFSQCFFTGQAGAYGGAAGFYDCEFHMGFRLQNRSETILTGCRFSEELVFGNDDPAYDFGAPCWYEASAPSPTIQGNAFMGDRALYYYNLPGISALPSPPITIGANYFGSAAGYNINVPLDRGFLPESYPGRVSGNLGVTPAFAIATPLTDTPVSGPRLDKRVLPRFWVNGHIVGQNTINHLNSTFDTTGDRILLKGRETLLSVDLSCNEESLPGVRVYAEWNGQEIEAAPTVKEVRRDPAKFKPNDVRYARSTFSFILPAVQESEMLATVRIDVSGVAGYDAEAYPDEDAILIVGMVTFKDPPTERLRIWVFPVEVTGIFGSWGTGNAAATVEALEREIPNQLPIPADKLQVTQKPVLSVWSPTTFVTSLGLLNRVSASLAFGRWVVSGMSEAPDFIVAVMPNGLITGGAEGASFVGRRRILFVDELYSRAALHELGHGIGLYTTQEQYDAFPPEGRPVQRATVFRNAESGVVNRVQHLPAPTHTWHDSKLIVYDTMGAGDPSAPLVETVVAFDNWFRENIGSPAPAEMQLLQANSTSDPIASDIPAGKRRILVSGATAAYNFKPGSLQLFDATRLGNAAQPPSSGSAYTFFAYSASGAQIFSQSFLPTYDDPEWVATFDVPDTTSSCRIVKTSDSSIAINLTATGLLLTTLQTPAAAATISNTLEVNWNVTSTHTPAPGQLRHLLFYRTAAAQEWTLLTGPTSATDLQTLTTSLPETSAFALRIVTSDGLESVEHIVDNITISPRAPIVAIRSPQPGTISQSTAVWRLEVDVTEFPPQTTDDGVWTSSLQGVLGTGRALSAILDVGNHVLRYETGTAGGLTCDAEVAVAVLENPTTMDLGFRETDLTLHHPTADPTGILPDYIAADVTNRFVLRLRNGGVGGTSRLRIYLQKPIGSEVLAATHSVMNEPFVEQCFALDCIADQDGAYTVRAVVDQVSPTDPDNSNNERLWTFSSITPTIALSRNPPGGGAVAGDGTYVYGATVTVGAIPNPGFYFSNWSASPGGTAISTEAEYSFEATADRTLWANFQAMPVITLQSSPSEGGSVSGAGSYAPGGTVTVLATANVGYHFVNWTEYGYEVSADASYSFTASSSRSLTANFEQSGGQTYTISLGVWPLEGGSVSGGGSHPAGATATVTATPADGYEFVNWTEWNANAGAFVEVSNESGYSFVVSGDRNLLGNFRLEPLIGDRTLAEALDAPSLTFTTGGSGAWVGLALQSAVHDGDAARSGFTADAATSWLQTTVNGPGTYSFSWRASTEAYWDQGVFLIDGNQISVIDGETNWLLVTDELGEGSHTLRWEYRKDGSFAEGDDCIWLDHFQFTPTGGTSETATTPVPVPHLWLDNYPTLLAAVSGDYEVAAMADFDGDGQATWKEYLVGSNPQDGSSFFHAGIDFVEGAPRITWQPDLGTARTYTVEGKASLMDPEWTTPNSNSRFFRVRVEMP